MEEPILNFLNNLWIAYKTKHLGTYQPSANENLTQSLLRLINPVFLQSIIALARGYALMGRLKDSSDLILNLLYLLPDEMRRVPAKGECYGLIARAFCEARNALYLLSAAGSLPTIKDMLEPTLVTTSRLLSGDGSLKDSVQLDYMESTSQLAVYACVTNPVWLSSLGQVQLDQFDTHPKWNSNEAKLRDAILSFKSAIECEGGAVDGVVTSLKEQKWFKGIVAEVDAIKAAVKELEAKNKPSGGDAKKGVAGKSGVTTNSAAKKAAPAPAAAKGAAATSKGKPTDEKKAATTATAPKAQANATKSSSRPESARAAIASPPTKVPAATKAGAPAASSKSKFGTAAPPPTSGTTKTGLASAPTKGILPAASGSTGSSTKLASKNSTGTKSPLKGSTASLAKTSSSRPATAKKSTISVSKALYEPRIGLARAYARLLTLKEESKSLTPDETSVLLAQIKTYYTESIKIKPQIHDAYIELGAILERKESMAAAADLYGSFPFVSLDEREPTQDDLYLYTELSRAFMKEKRYCIPAKLKINTLRYIQVS
jgi:hypothetical protein